MFFSLVIMLLMSVHKSNCCYVANLVNHWSICMESKAKNGTRSKLFRVTFEVLEWSTILNVKGKYDSHFKGCILLPEVESLKKYSRVTRTYFSKQKTWVWSSIPRSSFFACVYLKTIFFPIAAAVRNLILISPSTSTFAASLASSSSIS